MSKYLRNGHTHEIVTVDSDTGELIDVEIKTEKYVLENREEFIQLYSSIHSKLNELDRSSSKLFNYCLFNCDRENIVHMSGFTKNKISESTGMALSTINNGMVGLVKKKLLTKIGRATYRVNPIYAWKDSTASRSKMIKYVLEVECPNCEY